MTIERNLYLNRLVKAKNNGKVKILTGMRGSGKTYLLFEIFYQSLRSEGIDDAHIIRVNLEDAGSVQYRDPSALNEYIGGCIQNESDRYYVLIDEVQLMITPKERKHLTEPKAFYKMISGLSSRGNVDVYMTSSNSLFISTKVPEEFIELGQYIHVAPLAFSEFFSYKGGEVGAAWSEYLRFGGLPRVVLESDEAAKMQYMRDLKAEIFIKDINTPYGIINDEGMDDLLHSVGLYIGILTNAQRIANEFAARENKGITTPTVREYLRFLREAFIIERAERYDIKGKKYIHTPSKFYYTDLGMRNALFDYPNTDPTFMMENVVYHDLLYRGFNVDAGAVEIHPTENGKRLRKHLEVDFVANLDNVRYYVQTANNVSDKATMDKVQSSLVKIPDTNKKIIIIEQPTDIYRNEKGIMIINSFDFLLDPQSLDK